MVYKDNQCKQLSKLSKEEEDFMYINKCDAYRATFE